MSVLVEEWKVSFSKDVGLQLGTLLNITLRRRCFSGFCNETNGPKSRNTPDTPDIWLEKN